MLCEFLGLGWLLVTSIAPPPAPLFVVYALFWFFVAFSNAYIDEERLIYPADQMYMFMHMPKICMCFLLVPCPWVLVGDLEALH